MFIKFEYHNPIWLTARYAYAAVLKEAQDNGIGVKGLILENLRQKSSEELVQMAVNQFQISALDASYSHDPEEEFIQVLPKPNYIPIPEVEHVFDDTCLDLIEKRISMLLTHQDYLTWEDKWIPNGLREVNITP